jgi:hypothetical protein
MQVISPFPISGILPFPSFRIWKPARTFSGMAESKNGGWRFLSQQVRKVRQDFFFFS